MITVFLGMLFLLRVVNCENCEQQGCDAIMDSFDDDGYRFGYDIRVFPSFALNCLRVVIELFTAQPGLKA